MSGLVGSNHNIRGSGVVAKLGTDGQVFTSAGAGVKQTFDLPGPALNICCPSVPKLPTSPEPLILNLLPIMPLIIFIFLL